MFLGVVALAAIDLFLRLRDYWNDVPVDFYRFEYSPSENYYREHGYSYLTLDPEHPLPGHPVMPDGISYPIVSRDRGETPLVAVFGGSQVFGWGVEWSSAWPARLPALLGAQGKPIEVLNAAVGGFRARQSVGRMHSEVLSYRPDVALFCHGWNNLWEAVEIVRDPNYYRKYREFPPQKIFDFQRFVDELDGSMKSFSRAYAKVRRQMFVANLGRMKAGPVDPISSLPDSARDEFRVNLRSFVGICRANGIEPVLLTMPTLRGDTPPASQDGQKKVDWDGLMLSGLKAGARTKEMDLMNATVLEVGRELDAVCWDLASAIPKDPALYNDGVHFNDTGHALVAAWIAPRLVELNFRERRY